MAAFAIFDRSHIVRLIGSDHRALELYNISVVIEYVCSAQQDHLTTI